MEIIYIDSLFFVNLLTDYLLCLCAARICGLKLKRLRYLGAAFLGAVYSVFVFIPGFSFLSSPLLKLSFGLSMALIAYAGELKPFRCAAVFLAVSAAFGGALWAFRFSGAADGSYPKLSLKILFLAFTLCYSLGSLIFRCRVKNADRKKLQVSLSFLGTSARFNALLDTGNALSDPISGAHIMVVCPHALKEILGDKTFLFEELSPVELLELSQNIPELRGKLRLVSYSALGISGLLPVFRPESLSIDGKASPDVLVAVSKSAAGDGFEALI